MDASYSSILRTNNIRFVFGYYYDVNANIVYQTLCLCFLDMIKHTSKTNPDYVELEEADRVLKRVMT